MKKQHSFLPLIIGIGAIVIGFGFSSTASAAVRGSITASPPLPAGNNSQTFVSPP